MAIQIGGTSAIDNSRNIINISGLYLDAAANVTINGGDSQTFASDYGTVTGGTVYLKPDYGNIKTLLNNGAFTLAADSTNGLDTSSMNGSYTQTIYLYNSGGLAGPITFSGFTKITGDSIGAGNPRKYMLYYTHLVDNMPTPSSTLANYLHITKIA